jgi:hypothetical protein
VQAARLGAKANADALGSIHKVEVGTIDPIVTSLVAESTGVELHAMPASLLCSCNWFFCTTSQRTKNNQHAAKKFYESSHICPSVSVMSSGVLKAPDLNFV